MQFPQDTQSTLPIQPIIGKGTDGICIDMLRLDLIDDESSGNKWFKLKYNLIEAEKQGKKGLLTFGGAYSNHLSAVASICYENRFNSLAYVRGEPTLPLNDTLSFCRNKGMQLKYLDRTLYRLRNNPDFLRNLQQEYPDYLVVPEGGSNKLGIQGAMEIKKYIPVDQYHYIAVPFGSGGTIAGLINSIRKSKILGFSSLKNSVYMREVIEEFLTRTADNWELIFDYHFGGFAKINDTLIEFMQEFYRVHEIKLDPIYTSKMMYGLNEMYLKKKFKENSRILAIHTGGLQGLRGMEERLGRRI